MRTDVERKATKAAYDREYRAKNAEKRAAQVAAWVKDNPDRFKAIQKKSYEKNGAKRAEVKKATLQANPERAALLRKAARAAQRARDPQHVLERNNAWRRANAERARQISKAYRETHTAYYIAKCAERRAKKLQATPVWADPDAIASIYEEARGRKAHVDHVIPLHHPLVCGLHVACNLQVLSREANLRKSNSFDPETHHAT